LRLWLLLDVDGDADGDAGADEDALNMLGW
jgi:hypothetical protein